MDKEANLRSFVFDSARDAASLKKVQERESTPDMAQTGDFANTPFAGGSDYEREEPPKDHMRRYWRQYETTPIVREPVNNFARQVIEPGYWIEDNDQLSEDDLKELDKWLRKAAIIEKEPEKDILQMLKKAVVQREVRGTAIIEKVYAEEDSEKLYGLAFLNAETVRPNTRPGTPLLLLPNDKKRLDAEELPMTDDGYAAAYTQYTQESGFGVQDVEGDTVNQYSMDDIIKMTRDADVNEAFGTSRLEACSDVIEGLKNKMLDQNEAIASKAYPLWLFLFGTEEQPWDRDDINSFMGAHDMDSFHPGLKQGVRGDVDLKTISGEVADIVEYLEFDINYIMSSMPLPKYALGAFEANINQFVSRTQERNVNRQIKEARRELETEFSNVVQQKCVELFNVNEDDAEEILFKIGRPNEEGEQDNPQVNTIDYKGKGEGDDPNNRNAQGHGGDPNGKNGEPDDPDKQTEDDTVEEEGHTVWDVDMSNGQAELADPRLVSTTDVEADLADLIAAIMKDFRDSTVAEVRREYSNAPQAASMAFKGIANTTLNGVMRRRDFSQSSEVIMEETVRRTLDTLGQQNQQLTLDTDFGTRHRQTVTSYASTSRSSTRGALESLVGRMDSQLTQAAQNGEELETIVQRMENSYSDAEIEQRAQLIARMEIQNAIESTKLTEFEQNEDVAGVKIVNPCNENSTALCRNLAGCGPRNGAVGRFDSDRSLSEQWMDQAGSTQLYKGFTPMPPAPPFHFNCRSGLIPITEAELEDAMKNRPVTTVEDLGEKYGIEVDD